MDNFQGRLSGIREKLMEGYYLDLKAYQNDISELK